MSDSVSISTVSFNIKANADEASKSLDKLSGHLGGLNKSLKLVNVAALVGGLKNSHLLLETW